MPNAEIGVNATVACLKARPVMRFRQGAMLEMAIGVPASWLQATCNIDAQMHNTKV